MEKKLKKIPVITYLCYLLIVCILFTGVTFSRFISATSGDATAPLSRFHAEYEITDISAVSFANGNYWLRDEGYDSSINPTRSMRYLIRNYTTAADGSAVSISDVDLNAGMRLHFPAEFADNLALQLVQVMEDGDQEVVTPQYVLRDFIYEYTDEDSETHPGDEGATFAQTKQFRTEWNGFTTAGSDDYDDRMDGIGEVWEQEMTVTGGFTGDPDGNFSGTISAYAQDESTVGPQMRLTISASMEEANYSVGFARNHGSELGDTEPMLYLDLKKEIPFYTVDIQVPQMVFKAGQQEQLEFVLFLTVIDRASNDDFEDKWNGADGNVNYDQYLDPAGTKLYNGAEVLGYHFERKADVYRLNGSTLEKTGEQTTIRVTKTFTDGGGSEISFQHIAPLSEDATSIVHPIENFYKSDGNPEEGINGSSVKNFHEFYGTCSNGGQSGYISLAGIPDSPYYSTYDNQVAAGAAEFVIGEAISKGYFSQLNVVFVQASESGSETPGGTPGVGG